MPIDAVTNLGGKKEIRVYRNADDLITEAPDNSKASLRLGLMSAIMTRAMSDSDEFSEHTSDRVKQIIGAYEAKHGPVPRGRGNSAYGLYKKQLMEEALAADQDAPNLIGFLDTESYYVRPVSLAEEYERALAEEDNFVTLYFKTGEEIGGEMHTADGRTVGALPRSVFMQAFATGDTSNAELLQIPK